MTEKKCFVCQQNLRRNPHIEYITIAEIDETPKKIVMDFNSFEFSENTFKFSNLLNGSEVYYRLVAPSDLQLRKRIDASLTATDVPSRRQKSENSRKGKRGRPRKGLAKRSANEKPSDDGGEASARISIPDTAPLSRTRYGRVTRPPKHMSKFLDINEPNADHLTTETYAATIETENSFQPEPTVPVERLTEPKKIRRNLERFTCGVCKKIYLSKKKMLSHLIAFPDHKMPFDHPSVISNGVANDVSTPSPTNSFLFNELTRSLSTLKRDERCKYLLDELSNFVTHLNVLKDSLLPSCISENVHHRPYYIGKNVGQLLGIQEGNYNVNESVIEHYQCQMEQKSLAIFEANLPTVVSIQPSKYDLVPINEVNYDQITDNAMEAVSLDKILNKDSNVVDSSPILDISLDLFQFNGT